MIPHALVEALHALAQNWRDRPVVGESPAAIRYFTVATRQGARQHSIKRASAVRAASPMSHQEQSDDRRTV